MAVSSAVIRLIAGALLAHMALSVPLWYAEAGRTFPLLPLWGRAHLAGSTWMEAFLLTLWVSAWVANAIWTKKRLPLAAAGVLLLVLIGLDLNRLQPWTYFYLLAWSVLFFDRQNPAIGLRLLLAGVYVWGGVYKLTPYFAEDNFAWFCQAFRWMEPLGQYPAVGYGVAAAEALLGIGLLWPRSRQCACYSAVAFHLFIAMALSPWGLNWNAVVIPWNVAMAGMVWVSFRACGEVGSLHGSTLAQKAVVVLVWLMPALNSLNVWPEALSWKMYSNTQPEVGFFTARKEAFCPALRSLWEQYAWAEGRRLLFDDWAMADLHVPMFNHPRTHRQLAQYLCRCTEKPDEAGLWRMRVTAWDRHKERWEEMPCTSLP